MVSLLAGGGAALNVNVHTHVLMLARRVHRVIVRRRVLAEECDGWPQRAWAWRSKNWNGTPFECWRDGAATFVFRFVNFAADVMRLR